MQPKSILFPLGCLCFLYLLGAVRVDAENYVEGVVLNKKNRPIYNVLVRAYRDGKKLPDEIHTKKPEGSYKIRFYPGSPITIRYDHTEHHPALVEHICGSRIHNISKVIYRVDEELPADQKRNLASTLTQIYFMNKNGGLSDSHFFAEYSTSIKMARLGIDMLAALPFNVYEIPKFEISKGDKNIFDTAADIGSFNTFLEIVEAAGYDKELKYKDPITVFAPTDKAFEKLTSDQIDFLKKNPEKMIPALKEWTFPEMISWEKAKDMGLDKKVCGFNIIYPNIRAKNGLIHAVDSVQLLN